LTEDSVSSKQYAKMVGTPIPKLVTSLAIPSTISTLITVIYNTADTYFVSQIHESASAAVGVVYSIMAIIQAVGFGLAMGCSSLISRYLGKKQDKDACVFASSGVFAALLVVPVKISLWIVSFAPLLSTPADADSTEADFLILTSSSLILPDAVIDFASALKAGMLSTGSAVKIIAAARMSANAFLMISRFPSMVFPSFL